MFCIVKYKYCLLQLTAFSPVHSMNGSICLQYRIITFLHALIICWSSEASTPPGTHPRQYLVSQGRNILYPPKFAIVVFIIVNSVLTVHIIWHNGWRKNASKSTDLHVTIQNFLRGLCPRTPMLGRGYGAPPQTHPLSMHSGAARLSRLARGLNRPPNVF